MSEKLIEAGGGYQSRGVELMMRSDEWRGRGEAMPKCDGSEERSRLAYCLGNVSRRPLITTNLYTSFNVNISSCRGELLHFMAL